MIINEHGDVDLKDHDLESSFKCRSIVSEILDFGVSQIEILKIIKLLALELENREMMLQLCDVVDNTEV
jgi:hypothetical protein